MQPWCPARSGRWALQLTAPQELVSVSRCPATPRHLADMTVCLLQGGLVDSFSRMCPEGSQSEHSEQVLLK